MFRIEQLADIHERSQFASGSAPLDRYLRQQASQDIERGDAACFVAVNVETQEVAGYYTLMATSITLDAVSPEATRKLARYPVVPVTLLERLAVASIYQGIGLSSVLLSDALIRTTRAEIGMFAMLVDAGDAAAQRFCEHYGLVLLSGGAQRRMCLPIATALRQLV